MNDLTEIKRNYSISTDEAMSINQSGSIDERHPYISFQSCNDYIEKLDYYYMKSSYSDSAAIEVQNE